MGQWWLKLCGIVKWCELWLWLWLQLWLWLWGLQSSDIWSHLWLMIDCWIDGWIDEWLSGWMVGYIAIFPGSFAVDKQQLQKYSIYDLQFQFVLHWLDCCSCSCKLLWVIEMFVCRSFVRLSVCNNLSNVPIWLLCWRIVSSTLDHVDFFLYFFLSFFLRPINDNATRDETRRDTRIFGPLFTIISTP